MDHINYSVSTYEPMLPNENYRAIIQSLEALTMGFTKYAFEFSMTCAIANITTIENATPLTNALVQGTTKLLIRSKVAWEKVMDQHTKVTYGTTLYHIKQALEIMEQEYISKIRPRAETLRRIIGK